FSVYFLEWLIDTRVLAVEVRDGETDDILDQREVETFSQGKYYTWKVRGHVKVRITALAGNVVISGLFFDRDSNPDVSRPALSILSPPTGIQLTNSSVTLVGLASDNRGVAAVEYRLENSQGRTAFRTATTSNLWAIWTANITALVPGTNVIRVRARDESGNLSTEVTRTITYVSLDHLILITNGAGTIVPNLA